MFITGLYRIAAQTGRFCAVIGHSERVMKDHYALVSDDEFAEAAGTTGADLESPIPHAHDHAKPTETDAKLE